MLDKSIPYKNIIMRAEKSRFSGQKPPELPEGFAFKLYCPGDEKRWARLERSVDEFPSEEEALRYFTERYLPMSQLLERRCWFIWDEEKKQAAATATAWFDQIEGKRTASLHWVSTDPVYQGKRLGRAIVIRALQTLAAEEEGKSIYLHTQTWSHKAVALYLSLGFTIVKKGGLSQYQNDYPQYLAILREIMRPADFAALVQEADEKRI